jgi:hypothetical protein
MRIGFFLSLRGDVAHYLHAASLVREASRVMPGVPVHQLSDRATPLVPGIADAYRLAAKDPRPLLEQRLTLYSGLEPDDWVLLDTDVAVRGDVRAVFDDPLFDVALTDRNWPHLPQTPELLLTMPFNAGVIFSRSQAFHQDVLATWNRYPDKVRADWMSEQRAMYDVVRTGKYRVKILPGAIYNYPPASAEDQPPTAVLVHFKGIRKPWRSTLAYKILGAA